MNDLRTYQYLKAILEEGSITKAADVLYISQPSLTQYIRRIEEEMGVKILIRTDHSMKFTQAGHILYQGLEQIFQIRKEISNDIRSVGKMEKSQIVIGSLNYHSINVLCPVLPIFMERYPHVEVKLVEGSIEELERLAEEGKVDFALSLLPLRRHNLNYVELFQEEVLIAMSQHSSRAKEIAISETGAVYPTINLNELKNDKFIILEKGKRLRRSFEDMTLVMEKSPPVAIEVNDVTNALILAAANVGNTLCPNLLARNMSTNIPLLFFRPAQFLPKRRIIAIFSSAFAPSRYTQEMIDMLAEYMKNVKEDLFNS